MSKTLNLKVVGDHTMHCAGCEGSVNFTLSMLPGVESVQSDWQTQIISIDIDGDKVASDKVVSELANIGYQVDLMD